jgi:hypothetical protein
LGVEVGLDLRGLGRGERAAGQQDAEEPASAERLPGSMLLCELAALAPAIPPVNPGAPPIENFANELPAGSILKPRPGRLIPGPCTDAFSNAQGAKFIRFFKNSKVAPNTAPPAKDARSDSVSKFLRRCTICCPAWIARSDPPMISAPVAAPLRMSATATRSSCCRLRFTSASNGPIPASDAPPVAHARLTNCQSAYAAHVNIAKKISFVCCTVAA